MKEDIVSWNIICFKKIF